MSKSKWKYTGRARKWMKTDANYDLLSGVTCLIIIYMMKFTKKLKLYKRDLFKEYKENTGLFFRTGGVKMGENSYIPDWSETSDKHFDYSEHEINTCSCGEPIADDEDMFEGCKIDYIYETQRDDNFVI